MSTKNVNIAKTDPIQIFKSSHSRKFILPNFAKCGICENKSIKLREFLTPRKFLSVETHQSKSLP